MSNNTNLSKLANVLDDASDGQFLKSTGSGGVVFDDVAAGTTTVDNLAELEALNAAQGDMAFRTDNNFIYIRKSNGWYKIAEVANNQLQSVTITMSGGGTAGDPYALATDGTDTLATGAATDPEGLSVTWSAAPISPATLSGNNIVVNSVNVATLTQGSAPNTNVFTLDPVATGGNHSFSIRFSVTDGINATIDTDQDYVLNFITIIEDSHYTTLLAQSNGTAGDNSNITDSSSSSHTVTKNGSPSASAFTPYRSGGYSYYFTGQSGVRGTGSFLETSQQQIGTSDFTIEGWIYNDASSWGSDQVLFGGQGSSTGVGSWQLLTEASNSVKFQINSSSVCASPANTLSLKTWHHVVAQRVSGNINIYVDGTSVATAYSAYNLNQGGQFCIGGDDAHSNRYEFNGYIHDVRFVKAGVYISSGSPVSSFTPPSEELEWITSSEVITCRFSTLVRQSSATWLSQIDSEYAGPIEIRAKSPYDSLSYKEADNGGSIQMFGTATASNLDLASGNYITSGDFTVEYWAWFDDNNRSNHRYFFDMRNPRLSIWYKYSDSFSDQNYSFNIYDSTYRNAGTASKNPTNKVHERWNHCALVRQSGTCKFYLNGVEQFSWSNSTDYSGADIKIGAVNSGATSPVNGYMADIRIVNGGAVYTSNFAPPQEPLSTSSGISGATTTLHIKGTGGRVIDASQSSGIELKGNATSTTTGVTYNSNTITNGSFSMTGISGDYIEVPDMVTLEGTEDFTVEAWVYPTNIAPYQVIFENGSFSLALGTASGNNVFYSRVNNGFFAGAGGATAYGTYSIPNNQWSFVQMVRDSGVFKCYHNGTLRWIANYNSQQSSSVTPSNAPTIGAMSNGSERFKGSIQDLRVSKGLIRPTTVPTSGLYG